VDQVQLAGLGTLLGGVLMCADIVVGYRVESGPRIGQVALRRACVWRTPTSRAVTLRPCAWTRYARQSLVPPDHRDLAC
jgi:hypothetical protein